MNVRSDVTTWAQLVLHSIPGNDNPLIENESVKSIFLDHVLHGHRIAHKTTGQNLALQTSKLRWFIYILLYYDAIVSLCYVFSKMYSHKQWKFVWGWVF